MNVSIETPQVTAARLTRVIQSAQLTVHEGTYAFAEMPNSFPKLDASDALAFVRDGHVWSYLRPSIDPADELCRLFSFHFSPNADNSGFVGWLASHLKREFGTGVFVVCGSNRSRGGLFDYWGCPVAVADAVIAEVRRLNRRTVAGAESSARTLNGVRMRTAVTDARGVVDAATILSFVERDSLVTATYEGGRIRAGALTGVRDGARLAFRYSQVDSSGAIDGGTSNCEIGLLPDGRFQLTEHFTWESREGAGVNVFEEFPD